jgi:hypothetical protein
LFGKLQQRKESIYIRERGGEENEKKKEMKNKARKQKGEGEEGKKDTKMKIGTKTKRHS